MVEESLIRRARWLRSLERTEPGDAVDDMVEMGVSPEDAYLADVAAALLDVEDDWPDT